MIRICNVCIYRKGWEMIITYIYIYIFLHNDRWTATAFAWTSHWVDLDARLEIVRFFIIQKLMVKNPWFFFIKKWVFGHFSDHFGDVETLLNNFNYRIKWPKKFDHFFSSWKIWSNKKKILWTLMFWPLSYFFSLKSSPSSCSFFFIIFILFLLPSFILFFLFSSSS